MLVKVATGDTVMCISDFIGYNNGLIMVKDQRSLTLMIIYFYLIKEHRRKSSYQWFQMPWDHSNGKIASDQDNIFQNITY